MSREYPVAQRLKLSFEPDESVSRLSARVFAEHFESVFSTRARTPRDFPECERVARIRETRVDAAQDSFQVVDFAHRRGKLITQFAAVLSEFLNRALALANRDGRFEGRKEPASQISSAQG